MLRLYYTPVACSLSPNIALREAGLPFELDRIDLKTKKAASGKNYLDVNPKGYVPALELDDGRVITEGVAIVQYIADQAPESGLAPPAGTFERVRLQEWLNFIATELHKGMAPAYSPLASDELKQVTRERVGSRLAFLGKQLEGKRYLLGDRFSIADGYAFYAMRLWQRVTKADLPEGLSAYYARIAERPAVKAALAAEGLT